MLKSPSHGAHVALLSAARPEAGALALLRGPRVTSFYCRGDFSLDGRRYACGSTDGIVRVWDLAQGAAAAANCSWDLNPGASREVSAVAFSRAAVRPFQLAAVSDEGRLRRWDLDRRETGETPTWLRAERPTRTVYAQEAAPPRSGSPAPDLVAVAGPSEPSGSWMSPVPRMRMGTGAGAEAEASISPAVVSPGFAATPIPIRNYIQGTLLFTPGSASGARHGAEVAVSPAVLRVRRQPAEGEGGSGPSAGTSSAAKGARGSTGGWEGARPAVQEPPVSTPVPRRQLSIRTYVRRARSGRGSGAAGAGTSQDQVHGPGPEAPPSDSMRAASLPGAGTGALAGSPAG